LRTCEKYYLFTRKHVKKDIFTNIRNFLQILEKIF
jgi:hypothetical protein